MKFSVAAVLAVAAGVSASTASNVTWTTEVVDTYTTYCPGPTQITQGGKTYTITEATTFTITDCSCTVTKPVITTSAVVCHNCPAPGYTNSTMVVVPTQPGKPSGPAASSPAGGAAPTPGAPAPTGSGSGPKPTTVPVAGAGKVALSGAGLAGVVGLAAFFL